MILYQFLYCPCIYESAYTCISIHKTKKGAYKALNRYLNNQFMKEYNHRIKFGKFKGLFNTWKINVHCDYCIIVY